ncbi:MAG: LytTR family DNA-binding domain-containing protein [Bacteroidota bacterium]
MQKVAIIDDEAPARSLLREYLEDYPSLVIVGEANNGVDAIRLIKEFSPEIVFLDIQMTGMTGFEVLKKLKEVPRIIFSTAYDQYALKAFEVNAVDYLLKPYTKGRFAKAIEKVVSAGDDNLASLKALAENLLRESGSGSKFPSKILVPHKNRLTALDVDDIIWIDAEKDYSRLITEGQNFLSNYGIGQIEERLDPERFIRVHRSSIININFVQEIFKYPSSYDIKMKNGDLVRVSRSYLEKIRKLTF